MEETDDERHLRICLEVGRRMGRYPMSYQVFSTPCVQFVARQVRHASYHASVVGILIESHPLSHEFLEYREWLRDVVIQSLSLPSDTDWHEINRFTGLLPMTEYGDEEKFWEAHHFGEMKRVSNPDVNRVLHELMGIKFRSWKL